MNSCFKSVFPVFASRNIFNYLIKQRANDVLTYKVFYDIWKDENAFYRTMKSEGAYSPSMKPIFIPFANLLGRIITNFIRNTKLYKGVRMKILLLSNMYPSEKEPSFGIFVETIANQLSDIGYDVELCVRKRKCKGRISKLLSYMLFYIRAFPLFEL